MSVEIKPTDNDNEFTVNGKIVRKDMDGQWQETAELTPTELRYLAEYLNMLANTNSRGLTATYTT
jgi:hypothetical protein